MLSGLDGYKTYICSGISLVAAWAAYWQGSIDLQAAIAATAAALTAMSLRHGIAAGPK